MNCPLSWHHAFKSKLPISCSAPGSRLDMPSSFARRNRRRPRKACLLVPQLPTNLLSKCYHGGLRDQTCHATVLKDGGIAHLTVPIGTNNVPCLRCFVDSNVKHVAVRTRFMHVCTIGAYEVGGKNGLMLLFLGRAIEC